MRVGIDGPYEEMPQTELIGLRRGLGLRGGRTAHGTWSKADDGAPIVLSRRRHPLRLAPGNTWIELVPNEGSAAFAP